MLLERLQSLPQELQEVITSEEYEGKIAEISKAQLLTADQVSLLSNEIALVLFAFESYADLAQNIANSLKISKEKAVYLTEKTERVIVTPHVKALLDGIYASRPVEQASNLQLSRQQPAGANNTPVVGYAELQERRAGVKPDVPPSLDTSKIPTYQKPLTSIPRYGEDDPYHEPIDEK